MEEILKAIPVLLGSMIKFILGPTIGFVSRLHFLTTTLVSVLGMMTSVVLFVYFGEWIRSHIFRNRKFFSVDESKKGFWRRYGLAGIAFLTPVILTPIGGTLLAVGSGYPREKIIFFMFVSSAVWSLIFTGTIYFIGREVVPEFIK